MRMSRLLLILGCAFMCKELHAQADMILRFDKEFGIFGGAKIPYGKKVLLRGSLDSSVTELQVTWIAGLQEGTKEATLSDTSWSLLVGPFPPREQVIFRFAVTSNYSTSYLKNLAAEALRAFVDTLVRQKVELTLGDYHIFAVSFAREVVPRNLQAYKSTAGQTLRELLVNSITELDSNSVLKMVSTIADYGEKESELNRHLTTLSSIVFSTMRYEDLLKVASEAGRSGLTLTLNEVRSKPILLKSEKSYRDSLKAALNEIQISQMDPTQRRLVINLIDRIGVLSTAVDSLKKETNTLTDDIVEKAAWPLVQVREFTWASEISADVSDLEYYAGFDVGALALSDINVLPFFTINIYFKKVEIDQDPQKGEDAVSLTTGIALQTSEVATEGSIYFVGLGYRLNRLFRVTLGSVLYREKDKNRLVAKLALGVSLHFKYIADLLRIFSGASANIVSQ